MSEGKEGSCFNNHARYKCTAAVLFLQQGLRGDGSHSNVKVGIATTTGVTGTSFSAAELNEDCARTCRSHIANSLPHFCKHLLMRVSSHGRVQSQATQNFEFVTVIRCLSRMQFPNLKCICKRFEYTTFSQILQSITSLF